MFVFQKYVDNTKHIKNNTKSKIMSEPSYLELELLLKLFHLKT